MCGDEQQGEDYQGLEKWCRVWEFCGDDQGDQDVSLWNGILYLVM